VEVALVLVASGAEGREAGNGIGRAAQLRKLLAVGRSHSIRFALRCDASREDSHVRDILKRGEVIENFACF
jgi:hypothetical protein